jgi:hypothetical protein
MSIVSFFYSSSPKAFLIDAVVLAKADHLDSKVISKIKAMFCLFIALNKLIE